MDSIKLKTSPGLIPSIPSTESTEMKSLLPSLLLFLVSPASAGFLSHHKSSYSQRCRDQPVEKCSWVDVSHVSNVTETVCKKVPRESCVSKTVTELKAEPTKVCMEVKGTSCEDVVSRRCDTQERTVEVPVTSRRCEPAQQTVRMSFVSNTIHNQARQGIFPLINELAWLAGYFNKCASLTEGMFLFCRGARLSARW